MPLTFRGPTAVFVIAATLLSDPCAGALGRFAERVLTVCGPGQTESLGCADRRVGQELREGLMCVARNSKGNVLDLKPGSPGNDVGVGRAARHVQDGDCGSLISRSNSSRHLCAAAKGSEGALTLLHRRGDDSRDARVISTGKANGSWNAARAPGVKKSGDHVVDSVNINVMASIPIELMICRFAAAGKMVGVRSALIPSLSQVTSAGPAESPWTATIDGTPCMTAKQFFR